MEEMDYGIERGLDRNLLERLAELTFVKEGKELFITGSSGTDKSYIATALGYRACQKGRKSSGRTCSFWMTLEYTPLMPEGE